jgi:uncharacterized membrane protein YjjP (DUF1212 family)
MNPSPSDSRQQRPLPVTLEFLSATARLLFVNGQTTESVVQAAARAGHALGFRVAVAPSWGELVLRVEGDGGERCETIPAEPVGMDMGKVSAAMQVVQRVCETRLEIDRALAALADISQRSPVSAARFALMAAAGAAALGVIFGATHLVSLILIALSAGAGACLRRWLARRCHNFFVQPFGAALLAGIVGAIAVRLQLSSVLRLVAVCPCMVLVPGPHVLSGAMDLARSRIPLGLARITYAGLITLSISVGLLLGLALGGTTLPAAAPARFVPLGYDVLAAGVAVAAYGTFFNMPWRMLPIPIAVGMLAHACRWAAISAGANPASGAFLACLVVGIVMTPIADRLRLPFAGLAFASVVSLIPGVFLFRMAGGMVDIVTLGARVPMGLYSQVVNDGAVAALIVMAMTLGLVAPRILLESFKKRSAALQNKMPHTP